MEIAITDRISYIPQAEKPLSSDIVLIRGEKKLFVFDVGNNEEATKYLNGLPGPKTVIISHFHSDHTANLEETFYDELYVGLQTYKSVRRGIVVTDSVEINDGVKIEIIPVPNVHAKGSLMMVVNDELIFTGDATYAMWKDGKTIYNSQLLKEEIEILKKLKADKCFLSHDKGKIRSKKTILLLLENIYKKRTKDCPYIYLERDEKQYD